MKASIVAGLLLPFLVGCAVYATPRGIGVRAPAVRVTPPAVAVGPVYPAPAPRSVWRHHARYGWAWYHPRWGWHHPDRGWRRY